jgi:transposase
MAKYTFKQFQEEYPNDAACLARIMETQYGGDVTECQVCQRRTKFHPMGKRRAYACQDCGHHIYPCAGTIFHKSSTKLSIWFFAMYLMTSTRHGVAAKEIQRQTGVTYKCAWRICHELRKLIAAADANRGGPLSGYVEVDERILGGRPPREQKYENKTAIMGLVERGGRIIAGPVPDQTNYTLEGIENLVEGSTISTDELRSYSDLGRTFMGQSIVAQKNTLRDIHHVSALESHWSLFQRAVKETHVHISSKHAWKYVSEFS